MIFKWRACPDIIADIFSMTTNSLKLNYVPLVSYKVPVLELLSPQVLVEVALLLATVFYGQQLSSSKSVEWLQIHLLRCNTLVSLKGEMMRRREISQRL